MSLMQCIRHQIRECFGGTYRWEVPPSDDPSLVPKRMPKEGIRVAVIGSGLAGLAAASTLLENEGIAVEIIEAEEYIGGKCGAWKHRLKSGEEVYVSHGWHGVFAQYYNCRRFFEKVGIDKIYENVGEYLIFNKEGGTVGFRDLDMTPIVALISMWQHGLFSMLNVLKNMKCISYLMESLMYSAKRTQRLYDDISFEKFCKDSSLPQDLQFMFTAFARSFFATPDRISMSSLLSSFHFYFMSNDGGLLYDALPEDYHVAFCKPMLRYIEDLGGVVCCKNPVRDLSVKPNGTVAVNGKDYDYVVLACDVAGVVNILEESTELQEQHPDFCKQLSAVHPGQRYAVYKIWLDGKLAAEGLPDFFLFEKKRILDSLAICHAYEATSKAWVEKTGGGIYELHSYAVPDDVKDEDVTRLFLEDLKEYFPELKDAKVVDDHLFLRQNFTAFHTGTNENRPSTVTSIPTIMLAGDWVHLPFSCSLMEAAVSSGVLAANKIRHQFGMSEEVLYQVPPVGIFGMERDTGDFETWMVGPLRWVARIVWIFVTALMRYLFGK